MKTYCTTLKLTTKLKTEYSRKLIDSQKKSTNLCDWRERERKKGKCSILACSELLLFVICKSTVRPNGFDSNSVPHAALLGYRMNLLTNTQIIWMTHEMQKKKKKKTHHISMLWHHRLMVDRQFLFCSMVRLLYSNNNDSVKQLYNLSWYCSSA